ncbi:MAG TPA: hypothetical protein VFP17_10855 [Solirubrobacterales bacterium]|nr:hypothetical protein [Solirubrobacterales bacterium]
MKHLKILGLLVMTAASLMAFAGSSSAAPVLTTSAGGTDYTGEIQATLEKGTSSTFKAGIEDTCTESTTNGTANTNNTTHIVWTTVTFIFGGCSQHTLVITSGSVTIDDSGQVFFSSTRIRIIITSLGITCYYGAETGSVKIGTFTGGTPAKLDVNTTTLQRESGSNTFFCASAGTWTGSYVVTTPSTLLLT